MSNPNVNIVVSGPKNDYTSTYKTYILRCNMDFASQVTEPNRKYVIKYDFDLGGAEITIPENCVLEFEGGSLSNGTIVGNNTGINADITKIFGEGTTIAGTWNVAEAYPEWFDVTNDALPAFRKSFAISNNCVLQNKTYLFDIASFIEKPNDDPEIENKHLYGLNLASNNNLIGNGAILKLSGSLTSGKYYDIICSETYVNPNYHEEIPFSSNISIKDIIIDGNDTTDIAECTAIALYKCIGIDIQNITINKCFGNEGGGYGVFIGYSNDAVLNNIHIDYASRSSLWIWETDNIIVLNSHFGGGKLRDCATNSTNGGLPTYQKTNVRYISCTFKHDFSTGTHVFRCSGSATATLEDCVLQGNENIDGICLPVTGTYPNISVIRTTVYNCTIGLNIQGNNNDTEVYVQNSRISGQKGLSLGKLKKATFIDSSFTSIDTEDGKNVSMYPTLLYIRNCVFHIAGFLNFTLSDNISTILKNITIDSVNNIILICSGESGFLYIDGIEHTGNSIKYIQKYSESHNVIIDNFKQIEISTVNNASLPISHVKGAVGATSKKPTLTYRDMGFLYFDNEKNKPCWRKNVAANIFVEADGASITAARNGARNAYPAAWDIYTGFIFMQVELGRSFPVYAIVTQEGSSYSVRWVESDGATANVNRSGDSLSRPNGSDIYKGFVYMDTTLGKPIYAFAIYGDTVTWVDATGATV